MKNTIPLTLALLIFIAQFAIGGGLKTPSGMVLEPMTTASGHETSRSASAQNINASMMADFPVAGAQFAMQRRAIDKLG